MTLDPGFSEMRPFSPFKPLPSGKETTVNLGFFTKWTNGSTYTKEWVWVLLVEFYEKYSLEHLVNTQ
jgi:hypothetical protein